MWWCLHQYKRQKMRGELAVFYDVNHRWEPALWPVGTGIP